MFFAMLLGASGMGLVRRRAAGWWVAGLGLVGVLLILVANAFYPSDAFAWMFAIGTICVGLPLLLAGWPARLASLVWLASGIMGLPPVPRVPGGAGFLLFGVALLVLGYLLWAEAGPRGLMLQNHV
jgi:hypothetical protein